MGTSTPFMHYGNEWRQQRKWFQSAFQSKNTVQRYRPFHLREARNLLSLLCATPDAFMSHIKQYAGALMMEVAYGQTVTSLDDEFLHLADTAMTATVEAGGAMTTLVDFLPIIKYWPTWLPGSGFRMNSMKTAKMLRKMLDIPYEKVKANVVAGSAKPSLMVSILEENVNIESMTAEHVENMKGAAAAVYGAGADTTIMSLSTFILAMVLHPDIFLKAQAEVDRVIGGSRLPDFNDRDSLPYLECVLKEVYRWGCPVPLGIPHKLIEDDEYCGYYLPAGSTVIANIWAMTRKAESYPDPERFWPERFEKVDTEAADLLDPRKLIFGFGRRTCPGRILGDSSVWIAAASILATMDIRKARMETGEEILPELKFLAGIISHVAPFKCDIRLRPGKIVPQIGSSA
ncbi:uncharacterized protein FIBRA_03478 [Fibroporia radiculosa]|uniref:Cytochrome P450 n=1 Tax=Fibroporia radiculosa TaxID=599839 RepID=J4HW06_9APHY|nr:uncharacterized protein FIBRA_03478 [Fibroporia radiculosa]CCM01427.1 predicted protein [Fibroporia radiculosa]